MAGLHRHSCHHIKAPTPTWFLVKATGPAPPMDAVKKPAYFTGKKSEADRRGQAGGGGGLPASPRIGCMWQVKGRSRRWSGAARDRPATTRGDSDHHGGSKLTALMMGLFARRRGRASSTSSRACSKVRDVPSGSSCRNSNSRGGADAASTVVDIRAVDPPLPVVRRPAVDDRKTPSLWERRRGGCSGKALEGLRLA